MKKMFLLTVTFLTIAAFALTACASVSAAIANTSWRLVSYGPADNPTPAVPSVETALTFDPEGKFSGNVGCNSLSGSYQISGTKVIFGQVASTMMACDEALMQQESAVMQILSETSSFSLSGNQLTITSQDGQTATFELVAK